VYVITEKDYDCELKVKCKPVRQDGYEGEIFTSKSSGTLSSSGEVIPSQERDELASP